MRKHEHWHTHIRTHVRETMDMTGVRGVVSNAGDTVRRGVYTPK